MSRTVMLRRGIMLLAIGSLALCVATSAGAQTNLGKNKTGAQLYASVCANCHKSPQSLKPTGIFGLESFLGYTADRESAAAIATYLNGLKKTESPRGRTAKSTSQAKPSQPKQPSESKEGTP
jgi:mono/diheme cytochrome c family protein